MEEHPPPVGWADVAMKGDLESLEFGIDTRFEAMAHRLDAMAHRLDAILHREISGLKRSFIWMLLASNATFAALVLAAVKLL